MTEDRRESAQDTGQKRKRTPTDRSVPPHDALLLTVPQVAARLQIGVRTVWELIKRGKIAAVRIDACTRVSGADLDAFVKKHRRPAEDEDASEEKPVMKPKPLAAASARLSRRGKETARGVV